MYTPSLPPQRNENPPRTAHIHSPEETLSEHADAEQFKLYLDGRQAVYNRAIADAKRALAEAQENQRDANKRNNSALWALTEGQIEGTKELIAKLKELQRIEPNMENTDNATTTPSTNNATTTTSSKKKYVLRKLNDYSNRWYLNGQIFQSFGGLHTALDMGLALALKRTDLRDLPDIQWTYHATTDTYEIEL